MLMTFLHSGILVFEQWNFTEGSSFAVVRCALLETGLGGNRIVSLGRASGVDLQTELLDY